jgi:hypothetical protein
MSVYPAKPTFPSGDTGNWLNAMRSVPLGAATGGATVGAGAAGATVGAGAAGLAAPV